MQKQYISNGEKYFTEIAHIQNGNISGSYFLHGSDVYLHDYFADTVEKQ